jgi:hypothetical protein
MTARTKVLGWSSGLLALGCTQLVDASEINRGCGADQKECDDRCVSQTDPRFGCAAKTCQPCALPNATSSCSPEGECFVASCLDSFDDCNRDPTDGCEVDTDTDPLHCGGCDAPPCRVDGALPACANGECAIRKCEPGFKDCNRESDDGCETPVHDDPRNCGQCLASCDAGLECSMGVCTIADASAD